MGFEGMIPIDPEAQKEMHRIFELPSEDFMGSFTHKDEQGNIKLIAFTKLMIEPLK